MRFEFEQLNCAVNCVEDLIFLLPDKYIHISIPERRGKWVEPQCSNYRIVTAISEHECLNISSVATDTMHKVQISSRACETGII